MEACWILLIGSETDQTTANSNSVSTSAEVQEILKSTIRKVFLSQGINPKNDTVEDLVPNLIYYC